MKHLIMTLSSLLLVSKTNSCKTLRKIINHILLEIISEEKDMKLPQSGWVSYKIISIDVNLHKINLVL